MRIDQIDVVIPTTHRFEAVASLVQRIRATAPCEVRITTVDNCPAATQEGWAGAGVDHLIVDRRYLGSGEAFRLGIAGALRHGAQWILLLDHDAGLAEPTLGLLVDFAEGHPAGVFSCNQNGDGSGWASLHRGSVVRWAPSADDASHGLDLFQWSGLFLARGPAEMVARERTDYFFTWDDYLIAYRLGSQGERAVAVPAAVLENHRDPASGAWRSYYQTRNQLLFLRDTRSWSAQAVLVCVTARLRVAAGQFRGGSPRHARAILWGLLDGLRGRRGLTPRFEP